SHLQRSSREGAARKSLQQARDLAATLGAEFLVRRCNEHLGRSEASRTDRNASPPTPTSAETVIILFADIAESTTLTEQLGDWVFRSRSRALERALRGSVERNGGTSAFGVTLGDGILADFRSAADAAACAIECAALAERDGLPVHIGMHAGD